MDVGRVGVTVGVRVVVAVDVGDARRTVGAIAVKVGTRVGVRVKVGETLPAGFWLEGETIVGDDFEPPLD